MRKITGPAGNASMLTLLVVLLAVVALVAEAPSPPTIAEFAPTAQEQIVEAPLEQSSQFGSGDGRCSEDVNCTQDIGPEKAPAPKDAARPVINVARVRRCVGNPPRQIEDPQAPPCVNYFEGENGGATWQGVTSGEITVAFPDSYVSDLSAQYQAIVAFFNQRFELYGRKLVLHRWYISNGSATPEIQRAQAIRADEEFKAFATIRFNVADPSPFIEEASSRKMVISGYQAPYMAEPKYDRFHPYSWNYQPAYDELLKNQAEWICASLKGKTAEYGGVGVEGNPRKFGVVSIARYGFEQPPDTAPIVSALGRCGISPEVASWNAANDAGGGTNAMLRMQQAGVTSMICTCDGNVLRFYGMQAADDTNYFPEWLYNGIGGQDEPEIQGAQQSRTQRIHAFGLGATNRPNQWADTPVFWALKEMGSDPGTSIGATNASLLESFYSQMLLIASGVQMAGATLTPTTFANGLINADFPNPGGGGSPYYQATVGFGRNDHTMISDLPLIWFNEADPGPRAQRGGTYCYIDRGLRYSLGHWPARDYPFFDRSSPCR